MKSITSYTVVCILLLIVNGVLAQDKPNSKVFLEKFKSLEGKYFEGKIIAGGKEGDGFTGQKLIMKVMQYEEREVKIPFFVGENKSRTWIFSYSNQVLTLKHDHRHEDGSPDAITFYGGTATNEGASDIQMFPADQETCQLIDYACQNVWWITIDETTYTYNLRRIGSDRVFTVSFDLTNPIESTMMPW
ncbi:hypothetical protein [Sphingobacterium lumbrici]|uniref:hypothetical protein n=1 Tax=Sphingobacterium lumbrici TaxID=2559600 RepID=UPI00112C038F|nr:hypothetical protein [Sphingobacterium lumbrici]